MMRGELRLAKGYGMADLASGSRLEPATVMGLASLSKQFTAAAIALLIDEGRIDPAASIQVYIPEFPVYDAPIRVRDLVHHTSGLRDHLSMIALAGGDPEGRIPRSVALRLITRQSRPNWTPGTAYGYSNANYFLLAEIVSRVTSSDFRTFMRQRLFSPLGMTSSRFASDGEAVPGQAESYRVGPGGVLEQVALGGMLSGDGGAYATIEDLARWEAHFSEPRLGRNPVKLVERLRSRGTTADGQPLFYGWGTQFGSYRGAEIETHGGTWGGFRSYYLRIPSHRAAFAVLCNQLEISPFQLTRRLADIYLGSQLAPATEASPPPTNPPEPSVASVGRSLSPAEAAPYLGRYESDELDTHYIIELAADGAAVLRIPRAEPLPLPMTGTDTLAPSSRQLVVVRDRSGCVTGLVLNTGRVRGVRFTKRDTACRVAAGSTGGKS
jgi:CubicO group peptidase (beta-lactamase class C family)